MQKQNKLSSLIFATGNAHKVQEASAILQLSLEPLSDSLAQIMPPETGLTFQENALIKARFIFEQTGKPCFAEDSGLCVDAIGGAPGIYSARFAGQNAEASQNNALLLDKMIGEVNRSAHFIAVICYVNEKGDACFFEGKVHGGIATSIMGEKGFGYDPLFIPNGYNQSFAQLGAQVKNAISHRKIALKAFADFLTK